MELNCRYGHTVVIEPGSCLARRYEKFRSIGKEDLFNLSHTDCSQCMEVLGKQYRARSEQALSPIPAEHLRIGPAYS